MEKITFELTWNDIHAALQAYVKEKATTALEGNDKSLIQTYVSFTNTESESVRVESAIVTVKVITP